MMSDPLRRLNGLDGVEAEEVGPDTHGNPWEVSGMRAMFRAGTQWSWGKTDFERAETVRHAAAALAQELRDAAMELDRVARGF